MSRLHIENLPSPPATTTSSPVGSGWQLTQYGEVRRSFGNLEGSRRRVDSWLLRELESIRGLGDLGSRYRLDRDGTRARTRLALRAAQFGDGSNNQVIRAAELIELEHLASVFHTDDVTDMLAQAVGTPADLSRSNSLAILSGDMILVRANHLATSLGPPAVELIAEMMERFLVGKLQTDARADIDEHAGVRYLNVLSATAGNIFATGARMALIFSQAPAKFEEPIVTFAERIGIAFQLVEDDLHRDSWCAPRTTKGAAALEARQWAIAAMNAIDPLPACSATSALRGFTESVIGRRLV